ncbi:MAG: NCS2 family permease [Anaerovoracaceae bacterium]
MESFFKLRENGTDVKTEVVGGVTTFLSMVYILAVNPSILSASGMNATAVFTATAVSAAFATILMAFLANYPVALASGMGLNAYFAYKVCGDLAKMGIQDPYKIALTAVLVEGIIFILLTFCKFREALVNDVPANLKLGITAGIGLFIAIVGLKGAGIVVADSSTLVALGDMGSAPVALALIGLLIVVVLYHFRVPGYILWGILITWILGMIAQAGGWYQVDVDAGQYSLFPDMSHGIKPAAPTTFAFDFHFAATHIIDFVVIVFSFLFVDLFDTAGTLIGVASKGNLLDRDGNLPRAGRALMSDAVGTVFGAFMGTSTVTSYVESSAGVAAGARTGLASLVTGGLFLVALPLSPIFTAIPGFATAPALLFVGLLMVSSVKKMDFEDDAASAISGYLALIMMPFTYSIANGIMFGMLSYVIIRIVQGRVKEVDWVVWIAAILFVLRIISLVV